MNIIKLLCPGFPWTMCCLWKRQTLTNCLLCQLYCVYLVSLSFPSAEMLVRVWIQFITIHHLWQVYTVIYFKQQGMMLMMHGRRGWIVLWPWVLIINFLTFNHWNNLSVRYWNAYALWFFILSLFWVMVKRHRLNLSMMVDMWLIKSF